MKVADLIASFRSDTDDWGTPKLWSDAEICGYLTEAEQEAAIRKHLLYDDYTLAITTYTVNPGSSRIARNPKMFEVTKVWLTAAGSHNRRRLELVDRDLLDGLQPNWRRDSRHPDFAVVSDQAILLPGLIERPYILELEGYRLPLVDLLATTTEQVPEIAPIHHRFLLHWALHRAYQKSDSETLNPGRSAAALVEFEQYFGYRNQANQGERNQSDRPHRNKVY